MGRSYSFPEAPSHAHTFTQSPVSIIHVDCVCIQTFCICGGERKARRHERDDLQLAVAIVEV